MDTPYTPLIIITVRVKCLPFVRLQFVRLGPKLDFFWPRPPTRQLVISCTMESTSESMNDFFCLIRNVSSIRRCFLEKPKRNHVYGLISTGSYTNTMSIDVSTLECRRKDQEERDFVNGWVLCLHFISTTKQINETK